MRIIATILMGLTLVPRFVAQQTPKRLKEHETRLSLAVRECPGGVACKTFKQMVQAKDEDVLQANWACFYVGHNPAEGSSTLTDEFFLLMDGKATMQRGVHPGIFVNRVKDGMSDRYAGFGPEHGGLSEFNEDENKINPDGKEVMVRTYDDLGTNIRWAQFFFVARSNDPNGGYRALGSYTETLMRKSTGRFTSTTHTFTPYDNKEYAGQCLQLK